MKDENLEESVELTLQERAELNNILDDSYSRGAFIGMCTNIFFSKIDTDNILGIDRIIQIALATRLKAFEMAGKKVLTPEVKKESVKLVM